MALKGPALMSSPWPFGDWPHGLSCACPGEPWALGLCVSKLLLFAAGAELLRRQGKRSQGQRSGAGLGVPQVCPHDS